MPVITGTGSNDSLNGTTEADLIRGLGGADYIVGLAGDDEIQGGEGNDLIDGGEGNDLLYGGAGDDVLSEYSGGANDRMYGEDGNDMLRYSSGLSTSPFNVLLDGGVGDDVIDHSSFSAPSSAVLIGGDGNDRIRSSGGVDVVIDAGKGDDLVEAGLIGSEFNTPRTEYTDYTVTLGQGADLLVLDCFINFWPPAGTVTVTDFAAGDNGDALGLVKFLAFKTNGWAYDANPFSTGHLRLLQRGADAVLQFDSDGAGSANAFVDVVVMQNINALSLTARNLGGYAVDGTLVAIEFNGTAAGDFRGATGGDDVVRGFGGNDILFGGAGADLIEGGDGDDQLDGELGSDLIYGGNGADAISDYLNGDDRLYGGAGNDSIFVDRQWMQSPGSSVLIDGGADNDTLYFYGRSGYFRPEADDVVILGGDGDDLISVSGGGAVTIDAGAGSDWVNFSWAPVSATITLGAGADRVQISGRSDQQFGSIVFSDFQAGNGGDYLELLGFLGSLTGGIWDPSVNPFAANYLRLAQSGADTLLLCDASGEGEFYSLLTRFSGVTASSLTQANLGFAPGTVAIAGGSGADTLSGTAGADQLFGLEGDDILSGGGGNDRLAGGLGNDTYYVDGGDLVFEGPGEGRDIVYASVSYRLDQAARIEVLATSSEAGTGAITLIGSDFANLLIGNAGTNRLDGAGGDDSLFGLAGNDELIGGAGVDAMDGGTGNDSYYVDNVDDRVTERANQGRDVVYASTSYRLAEGMDIEVLATTSEVGTSAINLIGNSLDNLLVGNAGANRLNGGGGNDSLVGLAGDDELIGGAGIDAMAGGLGRDSYYVDNLYDRVTERAGEGRDIVYASTSYLLAETMEIEVLATASETGTQSINLIANGLDNFVLGNAGANRLNGAGGDDILFGLAGNDELIGGIGADSMAGGLGDDAYYVDTLSDRIIEIANEGRDVVYASTSYRLAEDAEIETLATTSQAGTDAIDLHGNASVNLLLGNSGANLLDGGSGADTLFGLGGADRFSFTSALGGGNVDTIADFQSGTDRLVLDDAVFSGLGLGTLQPGAFRAGASAADADDRIIYDPLSGSLYFDPDGTGTAAAIEFAMLSGAPAFVASDILVV